VAVVQDAPRLRRSWVVRVRRSARPAEVMADVEACLAWLEQLDAGGSPARVQFWNG
jgi:dienelactone hydrolase